MSLESALPTARKAGTLRAWALATRPPTLIAAVVPVAVGTACAFAGRGFRAGPAIAALLGAILIQVGTNFANDVFDHEKGADTAERLGPTRAVQAGLISASAMRIGMAVVFGLAAICGAWLAAACGAWVIPVGIASILCGVAYTGGPYPLGYHGLGEVFVIAFFGFVAVCGSACAQVGSIPAMAWWAAIPVGALASVILVVNNLRDRDTDLAAGKRTLAVRWGRRAALAELGVLLAVSFAVPLAVATWTRSVVALAPLLTAPWAVALMLGVSRDSGRALNARLKEAARLLGLHGLTWAIGLALVR